MENRATKSALDQIAKNSKAGIIGLYLMFCIVLPLVYTYFSLPTIFTLIVAHTMVMILRLYIIYRYKEASDTLSDANTIHLWVIIFRFGSFLAAVLWGSFLFIMDGLPPEYHFYIFSLLLGITAVGISTLGANVSIYLSFLLPLVGSTVVWMLLQEGEIYVYATISIVIGGIFYIFSVDKFAKNYKNAFIEEEKAKILKERMELALDGSNTSILDWDLTDNTFYISPNWKASLGFAQDELNDETLTWRKRAHPDDRKALFTSLREHMQAHVEIFEYIHRLKHKDGRYLWVLGRARLLYNSLGAVVRIIGTHTDITNEKDLQLKYFEQAQIIEQTHESVITTDFDGIITSWNHGAKLLFEYTEEEAIGQHLSMIFLPEEREAAIKSIEMLKKTGEYKVEMSSLTKSGKLVYALFSLSVLKDEHDNPVKLIGFAQDMTEYKRAQEKLLEQKDIFNHQAHHDALTALPNRILFNNRLEQAIQEAQREYQKFALLFLDLDHFKEINDSLGHDTGDKVLKVVAKRLHSIMRETDMLARLGGDEFTVIMSDLLHGQDASLLAQKILMKLAEPIVIEGNSFYVSCSMGISLYPTDGTSASDLLKYADAAMYKAKYEGRNNFQFYSADMTELSFERVVMEASLRKSIENKEFLVYYQPQINGDKNRLIGMEALVRWQHPTMGLVSPDKFLPLAESTGLIIALDWYVMETAMRQLSRWYERGLNPGILALNLTMKQLHQKEFLNTLKQLLDHTQCRSEWIELEISESHIMANPERAISILNEISALGIRLAVDDFGTGYSSLSYLKRLPIDKIKIDQIFIRDLPEDEEDRAITKAVIAIAKSLKLRVVAEGVETREQKEFLIQHACSEFQGYYYARPVPADAMEEILENGIEGPIVRIYEFTVEIKD